VPLGGNRKGRLRTYVNLLTVMLLGGLWHGAAYTYIVWGAIHGGALAIERMLGLQNRMGPARFAVVRIAWFLVTQIIVLVAWVFFRSATVKEAMAFLGNLVELDGLTLREPLWFGALFLIPLVIHHAWVWAVERRLAQPLRPTAKAVLAAAMAYGIATLYSGSSDFIYFQF
jgi:alginate O-acetyltransferase complex protein AlgI